MVLKMNHHITRWLPIGWALRKSFADGYNFKDFKADVMAAFVVSLIALPLSMSLSIAVGLPPQHGIYTAIVAGIVASFFGGSSFQINGPTAAFVVILIPIVADLGLRGLIWCQILAGFLLILFGLVKLGKLIQYVPDEVTIGFTSGIALVLATFSLKDFLGLPIEKMGHDSIKVIFNLVTHLPLLQWPDAIVGIMTLTIVVWTKGKIKWLPSPIIGVTAGTLLSIVLIQAGFPIMTIGTQFQYDLNGILHQGLPPYPPIFQMPTFNAGSLLTIPSWEELKIMLWPALVIAILAALESLLCATIADNLTQTQHHPNAELRGIGMANILTGMASGIPATAAIARTATNIQNGAKSPISGILHAVFVLFYVLLFARLMSAIPMSALAALLILTAFYMSHLKQFQHILSTAPVWDKMTLVVTFTLTVLMDMVMGISVGMILTMFNYILRTMGFRKTSIER